MAADTRVSWLESVGLKANSQSGNEPSGDPAMQPGSQHPDIITGTVTGIYRINLVALPAVKKEKGKAK